MLKNNIKEYNKYFWILQISGWSLFLLKDILRLSVSKVFMVEFFTHQIPPAFMGGFAATLIVRSFIKKNEIAKSSFKRIVLITLFSSLSAVLLWFVIIIVIFTLSNMEIDNLQLLIDYNLAFKLSIEYFPVTLIWHTLYFAIKLWILSEERRKQSEKSLQLAKEAQLEMLRYQLNPHFLFNTLNSLYVLTGKNSVKAQEMIARISDFLRYSLYENKEKEVPLRKEINAVQSYLDIELIRFNNKLNVVYDIERAAEEFPVPVFLIHPLVENAIKHGFLTSSMPLMITISAKVTDNTLKISVENSGKWIKNENSEIKGMGLENIKKRIAINYPGNSDLEILKSENSVLVNLTIKKEIPGENHES